MAKKTVPFPTRPLILTIILLSVTCFAYSLPTAQAAAQVEILSHSSYISEYGYYIIVGEVQNVGDQSVNDVEISRTYYDAEDAVIETASAEVTMFVLYPGRKSPFYFTFTGDASEVDHYALSISDFTPYEWTMDRQKLNITSHSSSIVEGEMIITGEIAHIDNSSAAGVKVLATAYDEQGTVVEMAGQSLIHWDAGETGTFEITLDQNVPLIDSYVLTAESSFLSIIPEFNSLHLTLLVLSLTSIAFFLSKRKLIHN